MNTFALYAKQLKQLLEAFTTMTQGILVQTAKFL